MDGFIIPSLYRWTNSFKLLLFNFYFKNACIYFFLCLRWLVFRQTCLFTLKQDHICQEYGIVPLRFVILQGTRISVSVCWRKFCSVPLRVLMLILKVNSKQLQETQVALVVAISVLLILQFHMHVHPVKLTASLWVLLFWRMCSVTQISSPELLTQSEVCWCYHADFKCQRFCYSLLWWAWTNHFTFLSFGFCICKMEMKTLLVWIFRWSKVYGWNTFLVYSSNGTKL